MYIGALAIALTASPAEAASSPRQGLPVRIEYTAPSVCPSQGLFFGQILERASDVRLATEGESATLVKVDVKSSESADPFQARLVLDGESEGVPDRSERVVTGHSCADVVRAVAFVVALFVVERAPHVEESAEPPSLKKAPPNDPERAPVPAPRRAYTALLASAGVRNGVGDVLGPSAGIAVDHVDEASWLSPSIRPSLTFASVVQRSGGERIVGRLFVAAVDACAFRLGRADGAVGVSPCVRFEGGVAHGDIGASSGGGPWLAPGALARFRSRFGGLIVELDAGFVIPLAENRFYAYTATPGGTDERRLAAAPSIATQLAASIGWAIW